MPAITEVVDEVIAHARARALEPVRVPWQAARDGFVVGFLLALVPAAFVTRVVADQVPFGAAVVHGRAAWLFALVVALAVGVATAVCRAAREYR